MVFKLLFDRDRMNLYPYYFADQCITKDIENIFGLKTQKVITEYVKGHMNNYMILEEIDALGKYLFEKIKSDKKFYKSVEKNILKTGEELLNFCNNLPKNFKDVSNEKLAELYIEYGQKTRIMRAWGWVPPLVDGANVYFLTDYLQEKFREFMKSIGKEDKFSAYYSIMSSSEKMSEVQAEEILRLKLVIKLNSINPDFLNNLNDEKIIKLVKEHAKKFGWLTYAYIGPVMNENDVISLIKNSLKDGKSAEEQIKGIEEHYKNLGKKKKEIIKEVKLPSEIVYLCEISAFFMHLKDMRKGIYQKSYVLMDSVIEEIGKRLGLSMEETKYLTQEEIKEALVKGKNFKEIAKKRTEYCVEVTENGMTKIYLGKEAHDIIEKEIKLEKISEDVRELKGSIAYSGKAKGIARIILVKSDVSKINEGEILISSATNPDLIIAMKKAAAFVTDTGGITSHAAIVSRELKKPCILGTKIATKVLHDGDLVEVDADKGIVKILEKAKI